MIIKVFGLPPPLMQHALYYPTNDRFSILLHFPSKFGHEVIHTKVEGNDLSYNGSDDDYLDSGASDCPTRYSQIPSMEVTK